MRKTTVYLPEPLKERLGVLSASTGRSEASLIREAIERLGGVEIEPASFSRPDDPTLAEPSPLGGPPRLIGIGVGPGDPELLTLQAARVLRGADVVLAPAIAADAVGRAESIVRQALPDVVMERLVFVMAAGGDERDNAIAAAAARAVEAIAEGQVVAFITLGDPNVYSTFSSVAEVVTRLRPGTPVETVAGIMAFQDLASRSGSVLTDGDETLTIVTALGGTADVVDALDDPDRAVVVYKGGRHLPAIADELDARDRLHGAKVGELLGLPGERLGNVGDLRAQGASYLATVIVPPVGRIAAADGAERGAAEHEQQEEATQQQREVVR